MGNGHLSFGHFVVSFVPLDIFLNTIFCERLGVSICKCFAISTGNPNH